MLKKFDDERINDILEVGISHFAEKGLENTNINHIAKDAGISVGVIYKYYGDKNGFFLACLKKSLGILETTIDQVIAEGGKPIDMVEKILRILIKSSRDHQNYINMYHEITGSSMKAYSKDLAREIEGMTSEVYSDFIRKGQEKGIFRKDMTPEFAAFFFDNLLMMLQFSYSADYYRERMKIYCGEDVDTKDEMMISEMLKFIASAFTFEESEIKHS